MKIVVIDNYDSFTYNLVHLLRAVSSKDVTVFRNDKFNIQDLERFDKIVLSPGPGIPSEAGLMPQVVKDYAKNKSILGVCLGHQCIAEVFGEKLINLPKVSHGKAINTILIKDDPLFAAVPKEFVSARYHSWVVSSEDFPDCLEIIAEDPDRRVMALRHKQFDIRGVQFHPESVITEYGSQIIENWLKI